MSRTGVFADTGGQLYQEWSGVLRNTDGTWRILGYPGPADLTHQSGNLWGCTQDVDAIYVTGPTNAGKVNTFIVTVDETLSRLGVRVGTSVVIGKATFTLDIIDPASPTGTSPISPNDTRLITPYGNLWLLGRFLM